VYIYYLFVCIHTYKHKHINTHTHIYAHIFGPGSVVGIATAYGLDGPGMDSKLQSALNQYTVRPFTESDDTRGCNNTICPPEDEQGTARNMLRIVM